MAFDKIGIIASRNREDAQKALKALKAKYDLIDLSPETAPDLDVVVVLGGDGFMLHVMHDYRDFNLPVYGMNCGTVGFLMNEYKEDGLKDRLLAARETKVHPLSMIAHAADGSSHAFEAINEVSLLRGSSQAAKIKISVDDHLEIGELVADGVLVATPAGSSAYNFSVGGPVVPMRASVLALTPISPFRPRRWKGALLPDHVKIKFDVMYHDIRPVNAVADYQEVKDVTSVEVYQNKEAVIHFLFDIGHSLEERIIREQFIY